MLFERFEAGSIYVQPSHIGNDERTEEGQAETKGRADDGIDCLGAGNAFPNDRSRFLKKDVL